MTHIYPSWLPEAVRIMADVLPVHAIKVRLTTDPKMQEVWSDLVSSSVSIDGYKDILQGHTLEGYSLADFRTELPARAAAAMLSYALTEFRSEHLVKMSFIRKNVDGWKFVASECRSIDRVESISIRDPHLAEALDRVSSYFEDLASRFERLSGPRVLDRASRNTASNPSAGLETDFTRVRCTSVLAFADKLYTCKHRKLLADFCSVGLARRVTASDIDDYRATQQSY